jgi:hypothetical protein
MNQYFIPAALLLYTLTASISGYYKSTRGQTNSLAKPFYPLGIFVFADALIIGPFWIAVSLFFLLYPSFILLGLVFSVFWAVRSFGETIYWLNQQFSSITREPPQKFWLHKLVKNDSVWFLNQLMAQITLVISLIATVILLRLYLTP